MKILLGVLCATWVVSGRTQVPATNLVEYPDHSRLLVVRTASGQERSVRTAEDWKERRGHILEGMQAAMGRLPSRSGASKLEIQTISMTCRPGYLQKNIRFSSEPGDSVPALLLIPDRIPPGEKRPVMLCLHQTIDIGKDEPAGLGGKRTLHYAHELASRGYVCMVPDYPSFGEYSYDFKKQGNHHASGSIKAVWNNMRALDVLETVPEADLSRAGVIGHSLGGHNALFTAAFDERLKAVVTSCGFTGFQDYYGGKVAGWTSDRYMPRIRERYGNDARRIPFDFHEVLAAIAPRGVFSNSPIRDSNFDVEGVRKVVTSAAKVYEWMGASDKLVLQTPDSVHDFPDAQREAAYAWLDRVLK